MHSVTIVFWPAPLRSGYGGIATRVNQAPVPREATESAMPDSDRIRSANGNSSVGTNQDRDLQRIARCFVSVRYLRKGCARESRSMVIRRVKFSYRTRVFHFFPGRGCRCFQRPTSYGNDCRSRRSGGIPRMPQRADEYQSRSIGGDPHTPLADRRGIRSAAWAEKMASLLGPRPRSRISAVAGGASVVQFVAQKRADGNSLLLGNGSTKVIVPLTQQILPMTPSRFSGRVSSNHRALPFVVLPADPQ